MLYSITGVFGLQCLVGIGDVSEAPSDVFDVDSKFKVVECGERGSQLATVENLVKNVTDTIENSWNTLTNAITNLAGHNNKKKRQADYEDVEELDKDEDDDNYACVKVVLGKTAYRSCIPKYGEIRINCTTSIGQNVLCYCHEDECNGGIRMQKSIVVFLMMSLATIMLKM